MTPELNPHERERFAEFIDEVIRDVKADLLGEIAVGMPHSEILEIAQRDAYITTALMMMASQINAKFTEQDINETEE